MYDIVYSEKAEEDLAKLRRSEPAAFNMGIMMTNDWLIIDSAPQGARHAVTWSIILFLVFVFFSCYKDYTSFLTPCALLLCHGAKVTIFFDMSSVALRYFG